LVFRTKFLNGGFSVHYFFRVGFPYTFLNVCFLYTIFRDGFPSAIFSASVFRTLFSASVFRTLFSAVNRFAAEFLCAFYAGNGGIRTVVCS
jgi:hypothetical protein